MASLPIHRSHHHAVAGFPILVVSQVGTRQQVPLPRSVLYNETRSRAPGSALGEGERDAKDYPRPCAARRGRRRIGCSLRCGQICAGRRPSQQEGHRKHDRAAFQGYSLHSGPQLPVGQLSTLSSHQTIASESIILSWQRYFFRACVTIVRRDHQDGGAKPKRIPGKVLAKDVKVVAGPATSKKSSDPSADSPAAGLYAQGTIAGPRCPRLQAN